MAASDSREEAGSASFENSNYWMDDFGLSPGINFSPMQKCNAIGQAWRTLSLMLLPKSSHERVLKYIRALFRNTVQFTLSVEFESLTVETKTRLKSVLKESPHVPCQMLSQLLPNPWKPFTVRSLFYDDDAARDGSFDRNRCRPLVEHTCSSECDLEPRHLSRARVEVLCYADFDVEALQLCLAYDTCSVLKKDSFFRASAFRLFYSTGNIARLTAELFKMTCHDSYHLLQQIQTNYGLAADSFVECLAQILLVRDFVGPSSYCCTLSLINMWCSLHGYHQSSLEVVSQEAKKLGLLASTSAHLYLFVDVLFKQYGRKLLVLYLHLYVHALTWDLNNFEYSKQVGCDVAVSEMETHLAAIYTKLGSLLAVEEDVSLARECILTAFSLEPTTERLAHLQMWSTFGHSIGPPRLNPCAGECHCSEKGLCRQNLPYSTRYAAHMPHDILDTTLCGGSISQQLLQDLCIVVEGPRCKRLTWNLSWEALSEICECYLRLARRTNAYGESLESLLRRRSQFEKWILPIGSGVADDSKPTRKDDVDEGMLTVKQEPLDEVAAEAASSQLPSSRAPDWFGKRPAIQTLGSSTQNLVPVRIAVNEASAGQSQDGFACPPTAVTESIYQMSKMDCLELEEAVRQLTDTNEATTDDAQGVSEYGYRSVVESQETYVPLRLERSSVVVEEPNVPMETDCCQPANANSMSTLESLLDSVSTMPAADFLQSSCEGIELLANSALQFGSLVGHRRPANITIATTESFTTPPSQLTQNVPPTSANNSQPDYSSGSANNRSRGIPMSLSELVQSVLSDDPPLVSPSQNSLDYNMPISSYQTVQEPVPCNVQGDNFGSNSDGLLTTSIGGMTQYCAANQLMTSNFTMPFTIHPGEMSASAASTTVPSSSEVVSRYSTVTSSSASHKVPRTILLTMPATSTMVTPQYLTMRTSAPSVSKPKKCIFRKAPVTPSNRGAPKMSPKAKVKREPQVVKSSQVKMDPVPHNEANKVFTNDYPMASVETQTLDAEWRPYLEVGVSPTSTDDVSHSTVPCNDILKQATISALGEHHAVLVESQFTNDAVPNALQFVVPDCRTEAPAPEPSSTTATTPPGGEGSVTRRRPRSMFNHRRDRCKWMSVFSPHGKLGYRKVVAESTTESGQTNTATATKTTAFSVPANKLNTMTTPALDSPFAFVNKNSNLQEAAVAAASVPVVKKCYSPVLIRPANHSFVNQARSVPKVFTVSTPPTSVPKPTADKPSLKRALRPCMPKSSRDPDVSMLVPLTQPGTNRLPQQQQQPNRIGNDGSIRHQIVATGSSFGVPRALFATLSPVRPAGQQVTTLSAVSDPISANSLGIPAFALLPPPPPPPLPPPPTPSADVSSVPTKPVPPTSSTPASNGVTVNRIQTCKLQPKVVLEQCVLMESSSPNRATPTRVIVSSPETSPVRAPRVYGSELLACSICEKRLSSPYCLRRHLKDVHKLENPKNHPVSPTLKVNVVRLKIDGLMPISPEALPVSTVGTESVNVGGLESPSTKEAGGRQIVNVGNVTEDPVTATSKTLERTSFVTEESDDDVTRQPPIKHEECNAAGVDDSGTKCESRVDANELRKESETSNERQPETEQNTVSELSMDADDDDDDEEEDDDDDGDDDCFAEDEVTMTIVPRPQASVLTRGRASSRTMKGPSKRGCPCCENDSPNSSAVSSTTSSSASKRCGGGGNDDRPKRNLNRRRSSRTTRSQRNLRVTRGSTTRAKT